VFSSYCEYLLYVIKKSDNLKRRTKTKRVNVEKGALALIAFTVKGALTKKRKKVQPEQRQKTHDQIAPIKSLQVKNE